MQPAVVRPRLRLSRVLVRAGFAVWAAAIVVVSAYLLSSHLLTLPNAAVNDRVTQAGELAVGLEALADLGGQLARGREDQRANRAAIGSRK